MLLKLYCESRNAIHLVSMQQHTGSPGGGCTVYSPSLNTAHWKLLMHTGHCTLLSSSYYLALLVTDPPNANLNHLKNLPIDQTTTFQSPLPRLITVFVEHPWLCPGLPIIQPRVKLLVYIFIFLFYQFVIGNFKYLCSIRACNSQFYITA